VQTPNPRRIAILAGSARSLSNFRGPLIRDLVKNGHHVLAMAPPNPAAAIEIQQLGADFVEVDFNRTGITPIQDWRTALRLEGFFRRERIDTLMSDTIKSVVYGVPAARRAGVETRVALITGLGYAFGTETLKQRAIGLVSKTLYRRALAQATAVRFQNQDDQVLFIEGRLVNPAISGVVAGSGVDLEHYPRVKLPEEGTVTFLLISRLLRDKGIREFVSAARMLRATRDDLRFHIVGPYDRNPNAISPAEVKGWEAEGIVNVYPPVTDVRPYLAACDVCVLPSYREGTPRTVLEAMATGRPIITTDAPGCRETTIDGENGFLVPIKDSRALAAAMARLADDRSLRERMAERSYEIARQRYDVRMVNRDMFSAMGIAP
jgi:glycosyltransferase involved in cell wall biosynthesis